MDPRFTALASNARSDAIAEATGDFIVWSAGDVLVAFDWLEAYASAFKRCPKARVLGGPSEPLYEMAPPPWIE